MQVSDDIIKVLDYLASKIGITIDWSNKNIIPYVKDFMERFIKYTICVDIIWIVLCVVLILVFGIIIRKVIKTTDNYDYELEGAAIICSTIMIIIFLSVGVCKSIEIAKCKYVPEMVIYDRVASTYEQRR